MHHKTPPNPTSKGASLHDHTFKQLLSHRSFFIAFCQHYLPPDVHQKMDWDHCELFKLNSESLHASQQTNKIHKKIIADIIYQVRLKQKTEQDGLILIHSEHYSRPDPATSLRQLHYDINALSEYHELNPSKPLPLLIPLVYYQGTPSPFPYSLDVFTLFGEQKDLARHYLLNPILIDLQQLDDHTLQQHDGISGAELALKYAFSKKELEAGQVELLITKLQSLDGQLRRVVLNYSLARLDYSPEAFLTHYLKWIPEDEVYMTSMAQQIKQRGIDEGMLLGKQEGIQLGKKEGIQLGKKEGIQLGKKEGIQLGKKEGEMEALRAMARKLLAQGMPIETIGKLTNLSQEVLIPLQKETEH